MWDNVGWCNHFVLAFLFLVGENHGVPVLSRLMNDQEMAICRRLGSLRERTGLSQAEMAQMVSTTRDQLASIEYGRNPLRYWLADQVCEKLDVCQQWLATGNDPVRGYVRLPLEIGLDIKSKELFSAAWERKVGHRVRRRANETQAMSQILADDPNASEKILENRLYCLTQIARQRIPPERFHEYFDALTAQTALFIQALPIGNSEGRVKNDLTTYPEKGTSESVKPILPTLIERLRLATKERGRKAELALWLGVSPQKVTDWLSGRIEPSGENTLRLLKWVEQQERQK